MSKQLEMRKTWREKLENPPKGLPKVVNGPPKWKKKFGGRKVLVPTPLLVEDLIRKTRKGNILTQTQIREKLAKDFKAEATCPITTGIFIRIIAEAAEEDLRAGRKRITPYWRVIKGDGSLIDKFPGGTKAQAARLKEEGHTLEPGKGKKAPKLRDFEKFLQKI